MAGRRLIAKSKLGKNSMDTVAYSKSNVTDSRDTDLILRCARAWDCMDRFRKERDRNKRYMYGDQWGDMVQVNGKTMTEEDYIVSQGNIPLKNNLIRRLAKTVIGTYRNQNKTPVCVARDRNEQVLGEVMSTMLEYNNTLNELNELNARAFEEFVLSGLVVEKETYALREHKRDCWTDYVNPNYFFMDGPLVDPRHRDIDIIGELHDMSFPQLVSFFARSDRDIDRLRDIYKRSRDMDSLNVFANYNDTFKKHRGELLSFLTPYDLNLCRVIQVWTLEQRKALWCHDWLEGDAYLDLYSNKGVIDQVNESRLEDNRMKDESGGYILDEVGVPKLHMPEGEVPLIEYEYRIESYWYYRFLSPFGDILEEGESPYAHHSHPYTVKAHPFIDGEIHSFVSDLIDQQRYINHYIILNDFIVKAGAKGVLVVDESSIPDDMGIEDIADEWTKFNGVIKLKLKAGAQIPQQIVNRQNSAGINEMIQLQRSLMEDVSGVHGALQGKQAVSGTSGILYQQQANNASTSVVDLLESFGSFIKNVMYKKMSNIQQFYDEKRIVKVAGRNAYVQWDPETMGGVEFDLSVSEGYNTPVYRAINNEFLMNLLGAKQITIQQMLEVGNFPFADQLLQLIQTQQQELQQQQNMQQQDMQKNGLFL